MRLAERRGDVQETQHVVFSAPRVSMLLIIQIALGIVLGVVIVGAGILWLTHVLKDYM
jgi:hypothetical protein